jgi:hypothetical protein
MPNVITVNTAPQKAKEDPKKIFSDIVREAMRRSTRRLQIDGNNRGDSTTTPKAIGQREKSRRAVVRTVGKLN